MTSHKLRPRLGRVPRLVAWLLMPLLAAGPGCGRKFFRQKADKEVFSILAEKSDDPRWNLEGYHVYPNPQARFADFTCPDYPPMPPDDPAAQCYSPNPQKPKKSGVGLVEGVGYLALLEAWDAQNRAEREAKKEEDKKDNKDDSEGEKSQKNNPDNEKKDKPKDDDEPKKDKKEPTSRRPESRQDPFSGTDLDVENLTPERILELAEERARRELAGIVTTKEGLPEREVEKAVSRERTFLIKLNQAVELGLINSREYQSRREGLYLAALPVTLERFAFAPQFFYAMTAFRENFGRGTPEGFTRRWRLETEAGFSKLFSTGALLLVSFANRTVFNLFNEHDTSVSTLSLDLIQPLLFGAGKAVTLEPLTQAERSLLYAIRDFAKFRQDFYVFIAGGQVPGAVGAGSIGGATVNVPSRFIPGALPVVGSAVPTLIGPQIVPGQGNTLPAVLRPSAPVQGYLATLVEKAQLVNQYRNIVSLERFLRRFRVYLEGGIVNSVQVGQIEQRILQSIENALDQQANYRTSLDQFKLQLGLPMCIRLEPDDEPLEPVLTQARRFEDLSSDYEVVASTPFQYVRPAESGLLRGRLRKLLRDSPLVEGTRFRERIVEQWREWEKLPRPPAGAPVGPLEKKLDDLTAQRDKLREKRDQLREKGAGRLSEEEQAELERLDFQVDLGRFELALRGYERRLWEAEKDPERREMFRAIQFNVVYRLFQSLLEEAYQERSESVRKQWPELPPVCVEGVDLLSEYDDKVLAVVTRTALANRLDLMNARAQLVDSWRKIRLAANALLGVLNVQYHFDTSTPRNRFQPFNFGGNRNRSQFIIDTELPLVRIQQRNDYRATLIAYQLQRRELQLAEDLVVFEARTQLRLLRAAANSYHNVQKRAFELAYLQVDQASQEFSQPQPPSGPPSPPGAVGPPAAGGGGRDPAALTQQLLNAQNSLLGAQNNLYNTWVTYLITRMSLYRDLGLMPIDPRGVWIDDVATCHCPPASVSRQRESDDQRPSELPAPRPYGGEDERPGQLPAPRPDEEGPR